MTSRRAAAVIAVATWLPGTTDLAEKGHALDMHSMTYPVPFKHSTFPGKPISPQIDERGFLVRTHMFIGPAWYQRSITIPDNWSGQHIQVLLERVMWVSQVWIDNRLVGDYDSLVVPHRYDLGPLSSGDHRLTIRVDNSMVHNMGTIPMAPITCAARFNGFHVNTATIPPSFYFASATSLPHRPPIGKQ